MDNIWLTILTFLFGIYKTYNEDQSEYIAKEIAIQKRKDDSVLLLRRWVYDTLKYKELLDSSKIVITNSLVNIEKGNKNLKMSESLIESAQIQSNSINKNLLLTNKLSFALPSFIGFQFQLSFKLKPSEDLKLINYLDSLTSGEDDEKHKMTNGNEVGNLSKIFYLNHLNIAHSDAWKLWQPGLYFLAGKFDFIRNKKPIFRLESKYLEQRTFNFKENIEVIYFKDIKEIIISSGENRTKQLRQLRTQGITSILDLINTDMYFSSNGLHDLVEFEKITGLSLALEFDKKIIYFDLPAIISPTKEEQLILRNLGIYSGVSTVLMFGKIKEDQIKGNYETLKSNTIQKSNVKH